MGGFALVTFGTAVAPWFVVTTVTGTTSVVGTAHNGAWVILGALASVLLLLVGRAAAGCLIAVTTLGGFLLQILGLSEGLLSSVPGASMVEVSTGAAVTFVGLVVLVVTAGSAIRRRGRGSIRGDDMPRGQYRYTGE